MAHSSLDRLPEDWVVVTCAACRCTAVVTPKPIPAGYNVKAFGDRVKGRPYCIECLYFPEEEPGVRRKSSDFQRASGQFDKLSKEFFS